MSNERLKFWVKCPDCTKPFGVEPRFVIKYLARVIEERQKSLDEREASLNSAQETRNTSAETAEPKANRRAYPYKANTYGKGHTDR